jgi:hypothetical protein
MVKGKGNATYQSLMNRFVLLVQGRKAIETSQSLKNSWEDTAMSNLVHDILAGNLSSAMHKYHG